MTLLQFLFNCLHFFQVGSGCSKQIF